MSFVTSSRITAANRLFERTLVAKILSRGRDAYLGVVGVLVLIKPIAILAVAVAMCSGVQQNKKLVPDRPDMHYYALPTMNHCQAAQSNARCAAAAAVTLLFFADAVYRGIVMPT